jgi:Glyoxalase superfamily protein
MSAATSAAVPKPVPLTPEAQAAALWTFVQIKAPRFTFDIALDLVKRLQLRPGEDPKAFAKRLRKALQDRGFAFKHTHALHAAARLSGYDSWHTNKEAGAARLRFSTLDAHKLGEMEFSSWSELAVELRNWSDRLLARSQLPLGVLELKFTGKVLNLSTPVPPAKDDPHQFSQSWRLGTISSAVDDPQWLEEAPAALEKLRRHLEEGGKAVLDGYAVLKLCATSHDTADNPLAVTASDVVNSELVLKREDNEDDWHGGYEIARGDELTCWHQLELSLRDDRTNQMPDVHVVVPNEGVGAWFVNGIRYVWSVETLKPQDYVPGHVRRQIGPTDCERLLRRYRLAKRIHGKTFKHHEQTKRIDYLAGPPENYRVDLHFLLHQLKDAGLTWESYCEKFGAEPLPMQDSLPVGFVFQLLENLAVEKPNRVFAKPNLAEMARVDDDGLLRALMPRVESVRFVMPRDVDDEVANELRKAVEEFSSGLRMQKFVGGALQIEQELPYLLSASEAEQLRATVDELGLVMYAAAVPSLYSTKGLLPELPGIKSWPWAIGHALFLRFERRGGAQ